MATPQIPPRPARTQYAKAATGAMLSPMPQVPPRPVRRLDRSQSPDRYAPSPLNDLPRTSANSSPYGNSRFNASTGSIDSPARPPSVTLPSIGQEGNEYADLDLYENLSPLQKSLSASTTQTSHVGSDLPLHAPKPALSKPNARAQVAQVTRTDSSRAAAVGVGNSQAPPSAASSVYSLRDDPEPQNKALRSKGSATYMRSGSSLSTERPDSASQLEEQGIPQIGRQVPMLPNAGDVQAPSPAPGQQFPAGIGFHNDGSKPRHHGRTRSGREIFHGPPGSYGLHGHGVTDPNKFEKDWYSKHPEALRQEESGLYSPALSGPRPEWALSSTDLNKIVRDSAKGAGYGTSAAVAGLPNEQIGYMASEEYAHRMASPKTVAGHRHRHSNSQTFVESPLRRANFPAGTLPPRPDSEEAVDTEPEDVIHIDPPAERFNKVTGDGHGETFDLGPHGGNTFDEGGYVEERGYGIPILASDEITPGSEWMQPAVSPAQPPERRGSIPPDELLPRYTSSAASSRPSSRPGSIHGLPALSKLQSHDDYEGMHTPLEDVDEYEPLFPDDDDDETKKPFTHADRLKHRPDIKRRFPSQDIWEDTPTSLKLETEVTSPEPVEEQQKRLVPQQSSAFETPDQEAARKGEVDEHSREQLLPREQRLAKSKFQPHIVSEMDRPSLAHRFPSQDIWEDSPDSASLTTTVYPQAEAEKIPADEGLAAGAVVHTRLIPREGATAGEPIMPPRPSHASQANPSEASDNATAATAQPSVPPRPKKESGSSSSSTDKAVSPTDPRKAPPSLPERPKPKVPARPSKTSSQDSTEAPLTKTTSATSTGSTAEESRAPPPPTKPKPQIPARPMGSKIAALQSGFMSDLNNRLKIGPLQPAKKEEAETEEMEEDKKPLGDARKSRARGPARRKPGVSPAATAASGETGRPALSISAIWTLWETDENGNIVVPDVDGEEAAAGEDQAATYGRKAAPLVAEPTAMDAGPKSEELLGGETGAEATPATPTATAAAAATAAHAVVDGEAAHVAAEAAVPEKAEATPAERGEAAAPETTHAAAVENAEPTPATAADPAAALHTQAREQPDSTAAATVVPADGSTTKDTPAAAAEADADEQPGADTATLDADEHTGAKTATLDATGAEPNAAEASDADALRSDEAAVHHQDQ